MLIGNAGAEFGVRGYVSAFDAETGNLAWRVFTVPGDPAKGFESKALEAVAKTWSGELGDDPRYEGELNAQAAAEPAPRGELLAWSPVEGRAVWRVSLPVVQSGGVLATAGNLVFQGRSDGMFTAYRASDGAPLWYFDAGTGVMAAPVTYLANGVQYVTVMVGWAAHKDSGILRTTVR